VTLLLVRHARAGDREKWEGDDRLRPLDKRGRRQANRLVELLADYELTRILASPYVRCVQTVEPLSRARAIEIEAREELGEELQAGQGASLVRSLLGDPVAVCCHGGLSDMVAEERQKKGETLVLDDDARVVARLKPD